MIFHATEEELKKKNFLLLVSFEKTIRNKKHANNTFPDHDIDPESGRIRKEEFRNSPVFLAPLMSRVKRWDGRGQEAVGGSSLGGIIHANIIRRAFTVHLMFHERVEWILHARIRAWKIFKSERGREKGRATVMPNYRRDR